MSNKFQIYVSEDDENEITKISFMSRGQQLAITIKLRSKSEWRYASHDGEAGGEISDRFTRALLDFFYNEDAK